MDVARDSRRMRVAGVVMGVAGLLAGCDSMRFGGSGPVLAARTTPSPRYSSPPEPTVAAIPSGSVTSEPLAPPPGASAAAPPPTDTPGPGPVVADVPTMPGSPGPVETLGSASPRAPAGPAPGSTRQSAVGGWTAKDAGGTSCRITLSSSPALDLYRASTGSCGNRDLAKVTAWDFKDGEVYLYQPGGAVTARLHASNGSLSGLLSKSGAPLTLTR